MREDECLVSAEADMTGVARCAERGGTKRRGLDDESGRAWDRKKRYGKSRQSSVSRWLPVQ